ncbi:hypothetical protein ABPG72_021415 [Tetrahymena utriculariae]
MGNCCSNQPGQDKTEQITNNPQPVEEQEQDAEMGANEQKARENYAVNVHAKTFDNQRETNRVPTEKSLQEEYKPSPSDVTQPATTGQENANPHAPPSQVAWPIKEIPNFLNEKGRKTLQEQGDFIYDEDEAGDQDLPKLGPYQFDNGSVYEGQWKNGQRHGRGVQYWSDGSVYEGYWRNNMAQGKGRLIHSDGDVFIGRWKEDKANGKGKYLHMDGAVYEGDWMDDKQHGKGVEEWPDGARYEGDYVDGKKHGYGKFHWADGSTYVGEFYKNNIHGKGCYDWSDGRKYNGEWKNNKMEGNGVFTWSDGRKYEGEYKDDKKHGYGVFEWPDSNNLIFDCISFQQQLLIFTDRTYKGYWANGRQHGKGIYIGSQGIEKEGEWCDGKRVKWIKKNEETGNE